MGISIYGILLLVSIVGLIHSMHVCDKYDFAPSTTRGRKLSSVYFLVSCLGCAGFGVLFFWTILTL